MRSAAGVGGPPRRRRTASSFAMFAPGPGRAALEERRPARQVHQVGRLGRARSAAAIGNWMLWFWPSVRSKTLALAGVARGPIDEPARVTNALGGDEDALGVPPVDDARKPWPSSPIRFSAGTTRSVIDRLDGRVVHHRPHRPHVDRLADLSKVDERHSNPSRASGLVGASMSAPAAASGPSAGPRSSDLAPVDRIAVAAALGDRRADARGICAGLGLGDAERLKPQLASGDRRQVATALLVRWRGARIVPMMYIWAWTGPALPPERFTPRG